jgi:YteA family regulatory protein
LNNQDLEFYRSLLLRKKRQEDELISSFREDGLNQSLSDSFSEFATYDNHPADVAAETFERSKDLALRENSERIRGDIERALKRIDEGTYGTCEKCGSEIPRERLSLVPQAATCAVCSRKEAHIASHRPVEEDVDEVFTGIFEDQPDNAAYDGEDAWQEVDRYGTSNAVGDVPGSRSFQDAFHNSDEMIGHVWPEDKIGLSYERSKRKHVTGDKTRPRDK